MNDNSETDFPYLSNPENTELICQRIQTKAQEGWQDILKHKAKWLFTVESCKTIMLDVTLSSG